MAAELNELFEQGITRCGELADAVDAAMDAIDETTEQARETTERVEEEAREARQAMRDLMTLLEKTEEALGEARQEAEQALEGFAQTAGELGTQAGGLLERIKRASARADGTVGRIDTSLDAQMDDTRDGFSELGRKTHDLEAEVGHRLERAGHALDAFRSELDTSRAEFERRKEAWGETLEELEARAQVEATSWVAGLQALLHRQAAALVNAGNLMIDRHNGTMDAIKQEFAEQAPVELAAALGPLRESLGTVAAASAMHQEALEAQVEGLEAGIVEKSTELAELKASLHGTADGG